MLKSGWGMGKSEESRGKAGSGPPQMLGWVLLWEDPNVPATFCHSLDSARLLSFLSLKV